MDAKKASKNKDKDVENNLPTAPVLGPAASRKVPQLISSTRSTKVVPVTPDAPEEPEQWRAEQPGEGSDDTAVPVSETAQQEPSAETQEDDWITEAYGPDASADAERPRWEQTHTVQPAPQPKKAKKKRHPFLKALLVLIVIAAAAYGAFWFGDRAADKNHPAQTAKPASQQTQAATTETTTTTHYDSSNFSLSFDYPSDWKLNDTASKLTVTSPALKLPLADGTSKAGHVVLTIQPMQTNLANYPANGATAALDSGRITYKQPSSSQRAATYLSYLGYGTASGLDTLFVTGDNGYQQGQSVPQSDMLKADPLISVGFVSCGDMACDGTTAALSVQADKWHNLSAAQAIQTLLTSVQLD